MQAHFQYDMPQNYYYGGGSQDSYITPIATVILLVALALIATWPRKRVIVPVLIAGVMLPAGIDLVIFGFHLQVIRLLVGVALLRFVTRGELSIPRWNTLDALYLACAVCNSIAYTILWGASGAFFNRLGFLWTTLGSYLIVRVLIQGKSEIVLAIRTLAILCFIISIGMAVEHATLFNVFSLVGGVLASGVRYGSIRAQGPFQHPIIAGTVGAMLLPLFVGVFWQEKKYRAIAVMGILASVVMTVCSSSSTPIMTIAAGVFSLLLWKVRKRVRMMRWSFLGILVVLQIVMKAPVWFLINRAGGIFGGSGYHRAMLIDNFIRRFNEWWLIGTQNNGNWGYDMWDVDNAFVAAGIQGGLITFILFIALVTWAFKRVGMLGQKARRDGANEQLIWTIGCCIFCNVVGFFGIVYFDQSVLIWCLVLSFTAVTSLSSSSDVVTQDKQDKQDKWSKWREDYRKSQQPEARGILSGVSGVKV